MTTQSLLPKTNLINPMLLLGAAEPGTKCKDCKKLIRFQQSGIWSKCALRPHKKGKPKNQHHRANWQACSRFQSIDPSCPSCGAKRLDECICISRKVSK